MKTASTVLALLLGLLLAACSIGQPLQPPTTFVVEPAPPAGRLSSAFGRETARMGAVRVAGGFSGTSLVYRRDDVTFVSDPYNAFITDPAAMLSSRIASWLDVAGPFRTVLQPGSNQTTRYVVEATVTQLYGDFRPGEMPAAVLTIQFALVDATALRTTTVFERTYSRRVPLPATNPAALARGLGQALGETLTALVPDLATAAR